MQNFIVLLLMTKVRRPSGIQLENIFHGFSIEWLKRPVKSNYTNHDKHKFF